LQKAVDALPKESADLLAEAEGHLADAYKAAGDETKYREAVERQQELRK
jgi:hypothetical protein